MNLLRPRKEKLHKLLITLAFIFVPLVSLGYSALQTTLTIGIGDVNSENMSTLYGVLQNAALEGTYARQYNGSHADSMSGTGSYNIYHWYGSNATAGTAILDKNNAIFANHCWQMIRTTDTGGVKMIYNGEVENNQCLNTRGTHVGYDSRTTQNLYINYYYGTSYTYDSGGFKLSGTVTTGAIKIGEYTCKAYTSDSTCNTLYYVDKQNSGTNYYTLSLNANSHYSQIGSLEFNAGIDSPSYVGYMYNTVYTYNSKNMTGSETMLSSGMLGTSYWYADSATWGSPTANKYNLNSPYKISSSSDYPNLVGKYTFRNTSSTYTNTTVQYIAAVNSLFYYYIQMNDTGNHTLADFNHTYTYGNSYTDNGNGTYTINNPSTIQRKDWYTGYSNVGANKYVCKNAVNNTCSELWYTTSTSNTSMSYRIISLFKYSKGFNWDGSKYILDNNTAVSFSDITDSTNKASLNNAHYTCWNLSGECTTISYIYEAPSSVLYYIDIPNGKSIENVKNEMLYNDDVNTTNSIVKTAVEAWFKEYLLDYSDYLEDTIFCDDRSQSNSSTNGWNPNGGDLSINMNFNGSSDLSCPNTNDRFSTINNKAKLEYKVGLMSYPEMNLLGDSSARNTGQYYFLISPHYFSQNLASNRFILSNGDMSPHIEDGGVILGSKGVRPAISLAPGTGYASGTGTMADPYIVDIPSYTITYHNNGGSGCSSKTIIEGYPIGSLCTPIQSGYVFEGWYTAATGGTQVTGVEIPTQNLDVYAHWSPKPIRIYYNTNGARADSDTYINGEEGAYGGNIYYVDGNNEYYQEINSGESAAPTTRADFGGLGVPTGEYTHYYSNFKWCHFVHNYDGYMACDDSSIMNQDTVYTYYQYKEASKSQMYMRTGDQNSLFEDSSYIYVVLYAQWKKEIYTTDSHDKGDELIEDFTTSFTSVYDLYNSRHYDVYLGHRTNVDHEIITSYLYFPYYSGSDYYVRTDDPLIGGSDYADDYYDTNKSNIQYSLNYFGSSNRASCPYSESSSLYYCYNYDRNSNSYIHAYADKNGNVGAFTYLYSSNSYDYCYINANGSSGCETRSKASNSYISSLSQVLN